MWCTEVLDELVHRLRYGKKHHFLALAFCFFPPFVQGKTGPKPKNSRSKSDAPRQRSKGSRTSGRRGSTQDAPAVVTKPEEPPDIEVDIAAAPVAAHTAAAGRERAFLGIYALTVGKLVPLVTEEALRAALAERQRFPMAAAAAVGVERIACDQAQVGRGEGLRGGMWNAVRGWVAGEEGGGVRKSTTGWVA